VSGPRILTIVIAVTWLAAVTYFAFLWVVVSLHLLSDVFGLQPYDAQPLFLRARIMCILGIVGAVFYWLVCIVSASFAWHRPVPGGILLLLHALALAGLGLLVGQDFYGFFAFLLAPLPLLSGVLLLIDHRKKARS
jgi:hypothetical protein